MANLKKVFSLLLQAATKRKALVVSLCSTFILVMAIGIYVSHNLIYEVYVDGVSIGYVHNYDEYESALGSIEETDGADVAEKLSAKPTVALSQIKEDLSHLEDMNISTLAYANYKVNNADEATSSNYSVGQAVASVLTAASEASEGIEPEEAGDTASNTDIAATSEASDTKAAGQENASNVPPSVASRGQQSSQQVSEIADEEASDENLPAASDNQSEEKLYICSITIENLAREMLDLKQPATTITIDGNQVVSVGSEDDAAAVIEKVKEHYTPDSENYTVLSVTIPEEINTAEVYEAAENILSIEDASKKIITGSENPQTYTINQGDTIWDIAMTNSTSTDAIQAANPDINMDKIQIGDEITLPLTDPYVHVEVEAKVTTQETIPYNTKEVSDKTLLKGKTKVTQTGENGKQEIVTSVTLVNGITTSQDIISTTTIKAAVDKIVAVGTKVVTVSKPSTGSSSSSSSSSSVSSKGFIRPCVGVLTSNYGYRASGFHTGVDLAAATGTKIVASKAGTVTFSGWKGNYGYCVIIDHGNGISTLYAHNSSNKVSAGTYVSQGQTIALMGSTGNSTGPHCHFEVRVNGVYQNPWNYIK